MSINNQHISASASVALLNQESAKQDTFLGDLVMLADKMISSSNPDMFYEFPRIASLESIDTYSKINSYAYPSEYSAYLTDEAQFILVVLILQAEGVDYVPVY